MPDECRPPEGTKDGDVCVLRRTKTHFEWARWWSEPYGWELMGHADLVHPGDMHSRGWRFHSLAEVPHD